MKSKDHDDRHHHDEWHRDLAFGEPILALCDALGQAVDQIADKRVSSKRAEVAQIEELRRVQYVIQEIQIGRKVDACHIQTFKVALGQVSAGWAKEGRTELDEAYALLDAIVVAFEEPASPVPNYILMGRAAGSKHFVERAWEADVEGEPPFEWYADQSRFERIRMLGADLAEAMQTLSVRAMEAVKSWRYCGEFLLRQRYWRGVGVALLAAERIYAELLCEAERVNRLQVDNCVDYLSRRFVRAGMFIEICRLRYNQITLTDSCATRTAIALESFTGWAGMLARDVRALSDAHSCVVIGGVQKMVLGFEQQVKQLVSRANGKGVSEQAIVRQLDTLHGELTKIEVCARDLDLDYFPYQIVRRGYGEINRARLALSDCGCQGGWHDASEAVETILTAMVEWNELGEKLKADGDERRFPASAEIVERFCKVIPALRTVWCAITESWQEGTCARRPVQMPGSAGRTGASPWPGDPGEITPPPPSIPMTGPARYPIAELETYGERLKALKEQNALSPDQAADLQKAFDTVTLLVTDPSASAIDPTAAAIAQRIALGSLGARLGAVEVLKTGDVGRLVTNVLPGRRYVELPAGKDN